MQKNELIQKDGTILRVLSVDDDKLLVIDCLKRNMPKWTKAADLEGYLPCTEQELLDNADVEIFDVDSLDSASRKIVHDRYTIIAGVLPFLNDEKMRSLTISRIADEHEICKQTVRNYLCMYLVFQNLSALVPKRTDDEKPLSKDEKNMRWALNKFFYTKNQNSLPTAYTMMLREKYSDNEGTLLPEFPTFNQFRYFYRKHKKLQTYYISRNGIKSYVATETVEWNGVEFTIQKSLPMDEMLSFVDSVVRSCFAVKTNEYRPEAKDFAIRVNVMTRYANIAMPANIEHQYDVAVCSGVVEMILDHINRTQFNEMMRAIDSKIQNIASSNIEMMNLKFDELVNAFNNMQERVVSTFSDVTAEDIKKIAEGISVNGMPTDEGIVKAYMDQKKAE